MSLTIEQRVNSNTNYLKLWCETCARTLKLLDYGLEEVAPGAIELLEDKAITHERRNHQHKMFIYEYHRRPTIQELRAGIET